MSGIEVLGLVLAFVPLFITAIEKYEHGYGILTEWIEFRTEFCDFSNRFRLQKIRLSQLAETTLRSVTESEDAVQTMLENPECEDWKDPAITERLRYKLSGEGEYEAYSHGIVNVYDRLKEIEKCLHIHNLPTLTSPHSEKDSIQESAAPDSKTISLKSEFKTIRLFFRRKRLNKRIGNITQQIDSLTNLINSANTLEAPRHSRSGNAIAQIFERARQQAASLHRAITNAWTCDCRQGHFSRLLLSKPDRKRMKATHTGDVTDEKELKVALPFGTATVLQQGIYTALDGAPVGNWCTAQTSMTSEPVYNQVRIDDKYWNRQLSISSADSDRTVSSYDSAQSSLRSAITIPDDSRVIKDLCYVLKHRAETESHLGYLCDYSGKYHTLRVLPGTLTPKIESRVVSLGQILSKDNRVPPSVNLSLSREDRLSIALIIANSLLELFSSPWLPDNWDKNNIYFFIDNGNRVMTECPFLVSNSVTIKESVDPKHSSALLSLGTVILELWFDQPLESQPCWRGSFGPGDIETKFTKFNAAATWQEKIGPDGGRVLHDITWRCIWSDFGLGTQSLGDKELVKAVYERVVGELENVLDNF